MPKAILFDLDDTIIAHGVVADDCWQKLCYRFAPRLGEVTADRLFSAIDEARNWYWADPDRHQRGRLNLVNARRELVSIAFSKMGVNNSRLAEQLADAYTTEREEGVELFPWAIDTLRHVRKQGIKTALVSNGSSEVQRSKMERFGLAPFFDYIQIEGEFGAGKPDGLAFSRVLEELNVAAQETWMVGDDLERDIGGAQRLGIFGIWLDWRGVGLPESSMVRPDRIIQSISELLTMD